MTAKIEVKTRGGKHFVGMQDFLNNPSKVRDDVLPKYGTLYLTRYGDVVMKLVEPDLGDMLDVEEFE